MKNSLASPSIQQSQEIPFNGWRGFNVENLTLGSSQQIAYANDAISAAQILPLAGHIAMQPKTAALTRCLGELILPAPRNNWASKEDRISDFRDRTLNALRLGLRILAPKDFQFLLLVTSYYSKALNDRGTISITRAALDAHSRLNADIVSPLLSVASQSFPEREHDVLANSPRIFPGSAQRKALEANLPGVGNFLTRLCAMYAPLIDKPHAEHSLELACLKHVVAVLLERSLGGMSQRAEATWPILKIAESPGPVGESSSAIMRRMRIAKCQQSEYRAQVIGQPPQCPPGAWLFSPIREQQFVLDAILGAAHCPREFACDFVDTIIRFYDDKKHEAGGTLRPEAYQALDLSSPDNDWFMPIVRHMDLQEVQRESRAAVRRIAGHERRLEDLFPSCDERPWYYQ